MRAGEAAGTRPVAAFSTLRVFIDEVVPPGAGGLTVPNGIAVGADGNIYVSSQDQSRVLRYGPASVAAFTVRLDAPSATPVTVQFTTANGTGPILSPAKYGTARLARLIPKM